MKYTNLTKEQLKELLDSAKKEYEEIAAKGYKVDIARGKPCNAQAALAFNMLTAPEAEDYPMSYLNYGMPEGIPEMRKLFAELLGLEPSQVIVGGNSSLNMMYDAVQRAMQFGLLGEKPWNKCEKVRFLCPVPGYDRHFAVTQHFGIDMINVPMDDNGPNMDLVESLVANDESVKGIWCVPKYSNPTGIVYSDEVVERLATMKTAAKDFRIFWDNAYCVHELTDTPAQLANIMTIAKKAGTEDRIFEFASTSKITVAGAGVACMGASEANIKDAMSHIFYQTIGNDKVNQYRHFRFLQSVDHIKEIMDAQRAIIKPKFDAIVSTLEESLGDDCDIAKWTNPKGGYFISLDVLDGCASRVAQLCKAAGLTLTGAGATYPYGRDDNDRNLRIAPTYTNGEDVGIAAEILVACVKLACLEKLAK